jgi:hypothetical protein
MEKLRQQVEQVGGSELIEQLRVSVKVLDQKDRLPPQMVAYHENIINYWALFFNGKMDTQSPRR